MLTFLQWAEVLFHVCITDKRCFTTFIVYVFRKRVWMRRCAQLTQNVGHSIGSIERQAAWHLFFRLEIHFKFNIIFNRVNRQILDEETRINVCKHSNKAL